MPTMLEIVTGQHFGYSTVNKFGRNPDLDSGVAEDITNQGGDYTGFNATAAEIVEVFSSSANDTAAGTGAQEITVYGLGVDGSDWIGQSEVITMNGATPVNTVNSYIRLHRVRVTGSGTIKTNDGDITIRQSVTTANVFALVPAGYGQTMLAAFTIESRTTGHLAFWDASLTGGTNADVTAQLLVHPFGEAWQVQDEKALKGAGSSYIPRIFPILKGAYKGKTDIKIRAVSGTNNTGVTGNFDLIITPNE